MWLIKNSDIHIHRFNKYNAKVKFYLKGCFYVRPKLISLFQNGVVLLQKLKTIR